VQNADIETCLKKPAERNVKEHKPVWALIRQSRGSFLVTIIRGTHVAPCFKPFRNGETVDVI